MAYLRQELSAPATAIMGYAEMLIDDAVLGGRGQFTDDLQRILDAGRSLHRLILSLLDPATIHRTDGNADLAEFRRTLRHDLRTPINAIKGYGEMLREDAADGSAETFVADLDKLLGEATLLLDRIDGLVTYCGGDAPPLEGAAGAAAKIAAPASMVESLLKAVRPVAANEADLAAVRPSRVLVVDDNASNRDLLSRRLQRQGHTVLQAEDGAHALALVEKEALDLILLDLMMPGISGYDVLALLKRDPRFRDIPVIMISALSELDSIVRCIEAGADDYLAKPFDPTLLRARVGSSLEKKHLRDREWEMIEALRIEKERSEQLLLHILPKAIVARLNCGETVIADQLSDVTILFADLIDFTRLSSQLSARDLVRLLSGLFSEFDRLALDLGVEKIKTVGDAYMLAGGLPEPRMDHAHAVADMALAMIEAVQRANCHVPIPLQMRIGIHSGDVVAGVIGTHKFVYDIWGDAVNIASRMESHGMPNCIQISAATHRHIHEHFRLEPHGTVDIKGKGPMETFILLGRR
ncbi:MAG: adenylate/guanylate cyclase domain-containing protein [Xanthobacteraceae bacterium]